MHNESSNHKLEMQKTENSKQPLLANGVHETEDPLVSQLPKELIKYVEKPGQRKEAIAFVSRPPLYEGFHCCLSALLCCYSWSRMVVVKQGQIALTQFGDEPQLLGPGRHVLLSPWNELLAVKDETDQIIQHGPNFIIKVKRGELGYGIDLNDGHPILLSQGKHVIRSNTFLFKQFVTLRDRRTFLDQIEIIRVEMGIKECFSFWRDFFVDYLILTVPSSLSLLSLLKKKKGARWVGYCYRAGALTILEPGLHLIAPPDRFGDFLSTQLSIIDLPEGVHDTSDYVPLAIKAGE
ncbi:hypothetical protein RFI_01945, partial [Reticulomyxa filosa]